MVSDIKEFRTGKEAFVEEGGEWRLDVEWVSAGQAD